MDVDRLAFWPRLLQMLEAMSEAHFVSIDFEMSGVTSRPPGISRSKQTLQERYTETVEAAKRYQILQVGLTFAQEDTEKNTYILRAYNLPLNPCVEDEKLDIERIFSFQSGAVDFLLKNGFRFEEPFKIGVPYLSRDEAKLAKEKSRAREDKSRFEDIELKEDDIQAMAFLDKIRSETNVWLETGEPDHGCFNITSRTRPSVETTFPELSNFDKRLVHQIIRQEYPQLSTQGRSAAVTIRKANEERENKLIKERRRKVRAQIARQTGFRYIIEALTGGSLSDIDLEWFAVDPVTGAAKWFDKDDYSARFNRAAANLNRRRPMLVGHNCFTDLVYFYQCLIGDLPDTVEEFRTQIHDLFPVIVDTKYMATHNCGDINPASSLQDIAVLLLKEEVPIIVDHEEHRKYDIVDALHEAGYDSYLTARIVILLSAKLEAAGTYIADPALQSEDFQSEDERSCPILGAYGIGNPLESNAGDAAEGDTTMPSDLSVHGGGVSLTLDENAPTQTLTTPKISTSNTGSWKKRERKRVMKAVPDRSRFATPTAFDGLTNMSLDGASDEPSMAGPSRSATTPSRHTTMSPRFTPDPTAQDFSSNHVGQPQTPTASSRPQKKSDPLMPPFASDFWRVYANKLRIFGTEERVLDLDLQRKA